jgi:hypothetical protein
MNTKLYVSPEKFYLESDNRQVRWLYYNPNSNAGGQYVESLLGFDLILRAAESDDFWKYLTEYCPQFLIDIDSEDFDAYDEKFENKPSTWSECTDETQAALILAANDSLILENNIEIDREFFIEDDYINALIIASFNVDARFGTSTDCDDTDDYLNVYANYYPKTEEMEFGYTLIKADGSDTDFVAVEITDSERDVILAKLKEAGLDQCIAEMQGITQ